MATKSKSRSDPLSTGRLAGRHLDQAALERDANIPEGGTRPDHKTVVCYNRACPDYRRPRTDGSACGCKRSTIGAS